VPDLPSGAVTFLFTDIEGSTRLVRQLRGRYAEVLAEHQRLREAFATHGGHEIDTAAPVNGRYTGLAVHRAARICAAGHGGQILVSQATQSLLEQAFESLSRADREAPLGAEDLELLARSVYMLGRDDDYRAALERAYHS
jgi:class 3 adenylate cyclase